MNESEPPSISHLDFRVGATLLVDKPKDWTSFDVVNKIRFRLRKITGVKRIKVGHAGTLDPMATGLLILCTGKFTKKLASFQGLDKVYTGSFKLGASTPSYDAETEIDHTFPYKDITEKDIEKARQLYLGDINQVPPMYSAIKVDGQPLYKRARKGEFIEIKARPVHIFDFDITGNKLPDIGFRLHCSKGTYVRSLAHDMGHSLDSGAYLTELRRTKIGEYSIEDAWNLEALIEQLDAVVERMDIEE